MKWERGSLWGVGEGRRKVGRKRKNGRKTRVENWGKWGRGGVTGTRQGTEGVAL